MAALMSLQSAPGMDSCGDGGTGIAQLKWLRCIAHVLYSSSCLSSLFSCHSMVLRNSRRKAQGLFQRRLKTHRISFLPHCIVQIILVTMWTQFHEWLNLLLKWGINCCDICNLIFCFLTTTTSNLPIRKICSPLHQGLEDLMQLWHQDSNLKPRNQN